MERYLYCNQIKRSEITLYRKKDGHHKRLPPCNYFPVPYLLQTIQAEHSFRISALFYLFRWILRTGTP